MIGVGKEAGERQRCFRTEKSIRLKAKSKKFIGVKIVNGTIESLFCLKVRLKIKVCGTVRQL